MKGGEKAMPILNPQPYRETFLLKDIEAISLAVPHISMVHFHDDGAVTSRDCLITIIPKKEKRNRAEFKCCCLKH